MFRVASLVSLVALLAFLNVRRSFTEVRRGFRDDLQQKLRASSLRTWIIGGMMGGGKSTFARSLADQIGVPHFEIDLYPTEGNALEEVTRAKDGWVTEANTWQIPVALAKEADVIVFLDYDNVVNYVRLLLRGYQEWRSKGFSWVGFKQSMVDRTILDLGRIVYRYGEANRKDWRQAGLLKDMNLAATTYIRCISPAELRILHDLAIQSPS
jgi:adenylate kinase family enzyme